MSLICIEPPASEPLTLAEVKAHCRANDDEDLLLSALIVAARERAEHETGRALITQRWRLSIDEFPVAAIAIPNPPLQSVQTVQYVAQDGTLTTLDASAYTVHTDPLVGLVAPAYGTNWPAARDQIEAVQVEFTVGYGAAAAVPQSIKQWMLLAIGAWYGQREAIGAGAQLAELPNAFWQSLLDRYRIWRLA